MSKVSREKKKEKQIKLPAEYKEGALHFKTGPGWKACHDSERDLYTAETVWAGCYDLYEINGEIFSELKTKGMERRDAHELINTGRHLYKSVSDRNSSYDIALDEDYAALCPWAEVQSTGGLWGRGLTDLAVAMFDSEKQNREQRKAAREKERSGMRFTDEQTDAAIDIIHLVETAARENAALAEPKDVEQWEKEAASGNTDAYKKAMCAKLRMLYPAVPEGPARSDAERLWKTILNGRTEGILVVRSLDYRRAFEEYEFPPRLGSYLERWMSTAVKTELTNAVADGWLP